MPKEKRAAIAVQVRKTHFKLGDGYNDYLTTNSNYVRSTGFSNLNNSKAVNRKDNVSLGIDKNSMKVESEFTDRYKQFDVNPNKNHQKNAKNYRDHHFTLGSSLNSYDTTHKNDF